MEYTSKSDIYIPTRVDKSTLLPLEQELIGDTENVFTVEKFEVSREELTTYKHMANEEPEVPLGLRPICIKWTMMKTILLLWYMDLHQKIN